MHTHARNSEDTRGEGSTGPYEFRARSWISPGLSLLTEIRGYLSVAIPQQCLLDGR